MARDRESIKHFMGTNFKVFFVSIIHRLFHWHSDIEIIYVTEGSVFLLTNQKRYLLKKGEIFILNKNEIHSLIRTKEINSLLAFQFDPSFCKSYFPDFERLIFQQRHIKANTYDNLTKKIKNSLYEIMMDFISKPKGYSLKLSATLNNMLFYIVNNLETTSIENKQLFEQQKMLQRLNRIISYIQQNFTSKILLKDIAKQENLDLYYLSHFIKKQLGVTFRDYLTKIRLEKAVELITNTNKNVLEISIECGFSDTRYLIKSFKKEYNCTPSNYKKEYNIIESLNNDKYIYEKEHNIYSVTEKIEEIKKIFKSS